VDRDRITVSELQILELVFIGVLTGIVGGMLGVGGSLVMIPAMIEILGPNQHLYQASAMIVNFFVAVPAVVQHRRARAIEPITVQRLLPLTMVAVVTGVLLSELPLFSGEGEAYLRILFGVFLLGFSLLDLRRALLRWQANRLLSAEPSLPQPNPVRPRITLGMCALVALPTGLVSGLLGLGGGVLAVPLQRRFLRIPMRSAIANSATIIIATSVIGGTIKNYAYAVNHDYSFRSFGLALVLIPTAVAGSFLGSRLTHELPLRWVKVAFFLLLSFAALRITYRGFSDVAPQSMNATAHNAGAVQNSVLSSR
jgi:uncharacterized protein